jgi:hypothetical protein
MTDHSTTSLRQLAPSAYLVAFALVFIPLFDAAMSLFPFRVGAPQWRFGAVGLFSNALMIPAIGVLIAVTTAVVLGHERTQRVLSILCWIAVAILIAALAAFSLDALQTRASVQPAMRLSFLVASATAAAKLLLGAATFVLFARGSRLGRRKPRPVSAPQTPLIRRDGPVATRV